MSVSLTAPGSAQQGAQVNVSVVVTNTLGYHSSFKTEIFAGANLIFSASNVIMNGQSQSYSASFVMPASNVTVLAWVERWAYDLWDFYGADSKLVTLYVAPPPPPPPPPTYSGTLTRMELEYNESWAPIPAGDIPPEKRGILHIWGRNDMDTNQKMGIYWFVADPEGYVVQEYGPYWELFWTGPGNEQGFLSSRFDLSKVGKYTVWLELLMNPADPQVVDRYIGDLCTVAAVVPEPQFQGFGITEYTRR